MLSPFIRPIRQKIIAIIKQHRYGAILDVCCGTGEQLKMLKIHGLEGKGIDLSEAMDTPMADFVSQFDKYKEY